jgi:hypothetical protein
MHLEPQDIQAPGWWQIGRLVKKTKDTGAALFEPSAHMPWEDWIGVITLPAEIAALTDVQTIFTYGSHLRRLPPQVGRMCALEKLDLYTSYSLHWLPYEITRCSSLNESRISTRALYGNRNTRLPFPALGGPIDTVLPDTCSVCDRPFGERAPQLFWLTLRVGTDTVPLLVHSCSKDCTLSLPQPPRHYCERPHKGGDGVGMPETGHGPFGTHFDGDRVMKSAKDPSTGETRMIWHTVQVSRETGAVSYVPDADK